MPSRVSDIHPDPIRPTSPRTLVPLPRRPPSASIPLAADDPPIGREREIAALVAMLRDGVRLLTLTGPGGVGKTRLALAVAAEYAVDSGVSAAVVQLAGVDDPGLVPASVAAALDLPDRGSPLDQIVASLRGRDLLLVLDTFERVLPSAAFVDDLVKRCPRPRTMVTSRSRLNLGRERIFLVEPLPVSEFGPQRKPGSVTSELDDPAGPAVRLFVDRARSVVPEFALTPDNAATIAEICRRLDGLPLAIELAAPWMRMMSPAALLARLDCRLGLLVGGGVDLPPRLRSLRDAIAWSYDDLPERSQTLLRRLAVFAGGFSLDAAEAVTEACASPRPDAETGGPTTLTEIAALVDASLVKRIGADDTELSPRFTMLDTIREFALDRMTSQDEAGAIAARHAAWYVALAERADPELDGPDQRHWLDRIDAEIDNVRAALARLLERGDPVRALRLAAALELYWLKQGRYAEGQLWLARAVAATEPIRVAPTSPLQAIRARALVAAGTLAFIQGDYDAAVRNHEAALQLSRAAGEIRSEAHALNALGGVLAFSGRPGEGRALLEAALDRFDPQLDRFWRGMSLTQLGLALLQQGETTRAMETSAEAIAVQQGAGDWWAACVALSFHGSIAVAAGELSRAREAFTECVALAYRNGETRLVAEPLCGLGGVAGLSGQPVRAARLLAGAEALAATVGFDPPPLTRALIDRAVAAAKTAAGPVAFNAAWASGSAMNVDALVTEALGIAEDEVSPVHLTPREHAVLRLLAEYKSDKEIGAALFISHRTAMWHVARILRKLGVASRGAAAEYAIRHGLV
jgi:predicted ATPase/DNA-binding CsgD family transcriptional regulator/Tfp pilus assembly protein PilF